MSDGGGAAMGILALIFGVFGLVFFGVGIVIAVFYILTLQKALNRCAPE